MENLEVKIKKMNITSILFSIIFILIGSFLLARPEDAIHLVSYALGIILIAWGVISVVSFFTDKESQNYLEFGFILGVFVLIFGIIILVKPDTIASANGISPKSSHLNNFFAPFFSADSNTSTFNKLLS